MSKINEDKCTYCSVEAAAMVYKCPECEFNPERKKETIINGVDVSGCSSLGHTIVGITCGNGERKRLGNRIITIHQLCSTNSNCLFKQLKRKEQKLAKALACIDKCVSDFYHEIGTSYYEELLKSAKELGLIAEAKDE